MGGGGGGGGGGLALRYRFCIRRVFFVTRYEVWAGGGGGGGENPLTIHEIYVALTPSDSGTDVGFQVCCR